MVPGLVDHEFYLKRCLELAQQAAENAEVPVGALIVKDGIVIAEAQNQPITCCDPTAHAEVCAIRLAALAIGNYRLVGCTLYSSIEPCLMCAGAVMHARLDRIVYGAPEPRGGALSGDTNYFEALQHLHKIEVVGNILSDESRAIIQQFFKARR